MAQRSAGRLLGNLARLALAAAAIAIAPSFGGCGGATTGYSAFASDGGGTLNANDATMGGGSGSGGGSSSGSSGDDSSTCISGCTADEQCQNSCPQDPNGGSNCCDVTSGTCMLMVGACPGPTDGGGAE
jgi:hypothetical protein